MSATGYREVLRTPGLAAWFAVMTCQRLSVAMAPLALVYLGRHVNGSLALGALLAAVFALAEAACASLLGKRFDRRPPRGELTLVMGFQGLLYLAVAVVLTLSARALPLWLLVVLVAVAGGVISGAHGGLRALLVRTVPESTWQAALSLESTATALMWAVGPAIVAGLVVTGGDVWPLYAMAALALMGVLGVRWLREVLPGRDHTGDASLWRRCWPALVHEGAVLMVVGAAYTALPALLMYRGASANLAGPALAGFAVAGIVGGMVYGSRTWPASFRTQVVVLILALTGVIAVASFVAPVPVLVALVVLAGFPSTPALAARAAGLQLLLPESKWSAGFSGLYAAGGIGFGIAGLLVARLLGSGPHLVLAACMVLAAAAAVVAGAVEKRLAQPVPQIPAEPERAPVSV